MVRFENVTRRFRGPDGEVTAVRDASFSVKRGEVTAVQGPSGSGKTTLLLLAGGLLSPSEGTITVEDKNPYTLPPNRRSIFRAQNVGFVFQQFHLIPYLTVYENIVAPLGAFRGNGTANRADELINRFGIAHRKRHLPSQLSAGEKQRTALARALLNDPKVILADEPTGNLDPKSAETVLGSLSGFAKDGGAVLLVTHDVNVTSYADTLMHMEAGEVREKES